MTLPRLAIAALIPLALSGCLALDAADAVGSAAGAAVSAGSTVVGVGAKTVGAAADALDTRDETRNRRGEEDAHPKGVQNFNDGQPPVLAARPRRAAGR